MGAPPLILIAEPSEREREELCRALQLSGHALRIETCRDGAEALVWLRRNTGDRPSLLVAAVEMERVGGVDLVGMLGASQSMRGIPIVLLSDGPVPDGLSVSCFVRPATFAELEDLLGGLADLVVSRAARGEPDRSLPSAAPK